MTETLKQPLTAYDAWRDQQPLATKTRTAYRLQVRQVEELLVGYERGNALQSSLLDSS